MAFCSPFPGYHRHHNSPCAQNDPVSPGMLGMPLGHTPTLSQGPGKRKAALPTAVLICRWFPRFLSLHPPCLIAQSKKWRCYQPWGQKGYPEHKWEGRVVPTHPAYFPEQGLWCCCKLGHGEKPREESGPPKALAFSSQKPIVKKGCGEQKKEMVWDPSSPLR